jgi:hypothetical protein
MSFVMGVAKGMYDDSDHEYMMQHMRFRHEVWGWVKYFLSNPGVSADLVVRTAKDALEDPEIDRLTPITPDF